MATEPPQPRSGPNWLWILPIALLGILLIVWLLNPSGDRDEAGIDDPIVMPDPSAPNAGATGTGLPEVGADAAPTPVTNPGTDPAEGAPAGEPIRGTEPPPPPAQ